MGGARLLPAKVWAVSLVIESCADKHRVYKILSSLQQVKVNYTKQLLSNEFLLCMQVFTSSWKQHSTLLIVVGPGKTKWVQMQIYIEWHPVYTGMVIPDLTATTSWAELTDNKVIILHDLTDPSIKNVTWNHDSFSLHIFF